MITNFGRDWVRSYVPKESHQMEWGKSNLEKYVPLV